MEVGAPTGAAYGEKSAERRVQRNGHRDRAWGRRARHRRAAHAQAAHRQLFPGFLELRRMAENALTGVIQETYIQGISTRSVDNLVKALGRAAYQEQHERRLAAGRHRRGGASASRITSRWLTTTRPPVDPSTRRSLPAARSFTFGLAGLRPRIADPFCSKRKGASPKPPHLNFARV
jgi:hypothetical protein